MVGCAALAALLLFPADEPRCRELRGRVVDERRFPIAGATVVTRWRNEDGSITESPPASSGADGSFAVACVLLLDEAESGTCELAVRASEERAVWQPVRLHAHQLEDRDSFDLQIPLVVRPASTWRLDVVDASGAVPGAIVELIGKGGTLPLASAVSDASGRVVIGGVPAVDCHVVARHATRGRSTIGAVRACAATSLSRLELVPTRSVAAEIIDVDRADPVVGARVQVHLLLRQLNEPGGAHERRDWPLLAAESTTDAAGRVTLRDLPGDLPLELTAVAPHWLARWVEGDCFASERSTDQAPVPLASDATTALLRMKALVPKEVRWPVDPTGVAPREGDRIELRPLRGSRRVVRRDDTFPDAGVLRDGEVVLSCEVPAGSELHADPRHDLASQMWLAVTPDGAVASPQFERGDESPIPLRFEPTTTLDLTLLAADGAPLAEQQVYLMRDAPAEAALDWRPFIATTDARGVARFEELRLGRWVVMSTVATRTVALERAARAIVLRRTVDVPATEYRFEFTLEGKRRLPADYRIDFIGGGMERFRDRIELPQAGDVRCFVEPGRPYGEWHALVGLPGRARRIDLPPLTTTGAPPPPLVFPVDLSADDRGTVDVHVRSASTSYVHVTLERVAPDGTVIASGRMHSATRDSGPDVETWTFRDLEPGMWRASAHYGFVATAPFRVEAGDKPATVELDVSRFTELSVDWKVPDGESRAFAEVVAVGATPTDRCRSRMDEWWGPPESDATTGRFLFDGAHPPKLEIRHPCLRSSRWNDAIDLAKPRSTLTLHLELGPLLEFAPRFDGEPPAKTAQLTGMWLRIAPLTADGAAPTSAGERRVALRRGATFATAPLPAGNWRVLIDPQIAAPVELARFESDGAARDLGAIAFARGSTLRVRIVAPESFAAPRVAARAERIDGLRYVRGSGPQPLSEAPVDPEIPALGAGRFRIVVMPASGGGTEWTTTAEVDGVHDAEVTIVAE